MFFIPTNTFKVIELTLKQLLSFNRIDFTCVMDALRARNVTSVSLVLRKEKKQLYILQNQNLYY